MTESHIDVTVPKEYAAEMAGVSLRWAAASDPGKIRQTNEDGALTGAGVYILADGMGGHEGGEIASAAALAALSTIGIDDYEVTLDNLSKSLIKASEEIGEISTQTGRQAGTTLTGAMLTLKDGKTHWLIINIGDSRTYLHSGGKLSQITTDHSQVQELVDSGFISKEQARVDPRRNVITRALGAGMLPECEYWLYPVMAGDRILICSDGLNGEIDDDVIDKILGEKKTSHETVYELVQEVLNTKARDNVTIIVIDVNKIDEKYVKVTDEADDAVFHGELVFADGPDGLFVVDN